jgi:hypothetical protein
MVTRWQSAVLFVVLMVLGVDPSSAASMVVFDFDAIQSSSKKGPRASDIESYMENLFGADLTVSPNTVASGSKPSVRNLRVLGMPSDTLGASNSFLKIGKGKGNSGIAFDFGDNPIHSFSVDYQLFKKAKSFAILADGVKISEQTLTKAQRKSGLAGHQSAYYFDGPVKTLQFVGFKKKSFNIDNLTINIPLESDAGEVESYDSGIPTLLKFFQSNFSSDTPVAFVVSNNLNQLNATAAVPEPASVFLVTAGFIGILGANRKLTC